MLIIAWDNVAPGDIIQKKVLYNLSSIFITAAILRLLQSMIRSLDWLLYIYMIMLRSEVFDWCLNSGYSV